MVFRSAKFASKANFKITSEYTTTLVLFTDTISTLDYFDISKYTDL